uniref:Uncharacterized protein n=1 Tax=Anguilla anguilla TaxID=7936 RepID=A0A0E9R927_ANGAN
MTQVARDPHVTQKLLLRAQRWMSGEKACLL